MMEFLAITKWFGWGTIGILKPTISVIILLVIIFWKPLWKRIGTFRGLGHHDEA